MKKVIIILALAIIVVAGIFFIRQALVHYRSQQLLNKYYADLDSRIAGLTPDTLILQPFEPDTSLTISAERIQITIPRIDTAKLVFPGNKSSYRLHFKDSSLIALIESTSTFSLYSSLQAGEGSFSALFEELKNRNITTEYQFLNYIYRYTPGKGNFLASDKGIRLKYETVALKHLIMPRGADRKLLTYKTDQVKGFQYNDPLQGDALLHFFSALDEEFTLITKGFNQQEINYILNSVKVTDSH